jgi:mono/diheme cytochrome c family protein
MSTTKPRAAARSARVCAALLCVASHGCGSERSSDAEPTGNAPPPPATISALEPPRSATEPEAVEPEPPEPDEIGDLMKDHFGMASQVRDAVVRGQLEQAEAPLVWLGQHGLASSMPATWRIHVERMQLTARRASSASTLAAAGQAVGQLAAECGACHATLRQGPEFEPSDVNDLGPTGASPALRERMHRQLWAIERLWEGLVGPSNAAWQAGADNLRQGHGHSRVPAPQQARLERVRGLGVEAGDAASRADRGQIYGRILAECGNCHASAGIDPGTLAPNRRKDMRP